MNSNVDIILVEPEIAGNVGAVARIMKNFGFHNLILINPKCDPKSSEAVCRAKNAQDVLDDLKIVASIDKLSYNHKIGTSGKLGSDYNIPRSPTTPAELSENIPPGKIGIFFGRESHGLTNDEITKMDFLLTIPANPKYPILNLSHAVTVVVYELSKKNSQIREKFKPLEDKDKEILKSLIKKKLDDIAFETESKRRTQTTLWRKIIGKSMLTRREGFALMGFFRKLLEETSKNRNKKE